MGARDGDSLRGALVSMGARDGRVGDGDVDEIGDRFSSWSTT
jgi:hypothetical protein